jgi:hypothetical protein
MLVCAEGKERGCDASLLQSGAERLLEGRMKQQGKSPVELETAAALRRPSRRSELSRATRSEP